MRHVVPEQLVKDVWGLGCEPYPAVPGAKEKGGASEEAAKAIAPIAADLRGQCAKLFFESFPAGLTADECGERLRVSPLSVRPRISELRSAGLIKPTGERRRNRVSMQSATVWCASPVLMGDPHIETEKHSAVDDGGRE